MSGSKDARTFARSFSHLLKRAVQYSVHCYMEEAGKSGLTHRQFTVLSAVDTHEGKSQTELVKITGIDRSTLADLVRRLVEKGLLHRKRTRRDARMYAVRLTEKGQAALRKAEPVARSTDERLLSAIPQREREVFLEALSKIVQMIGGDGTKRVVEGPK